MIYTKIVFIPQLTKEQSNFLNKYGNNIKKLKYQRQIVKMSVKKFTKHTITIIRNL